MKLYFHLTSEIEAPFWSLLDSHVNKATRPCPTQDDSQSRELQETNSYDKLYTIRLENTCNVPIYATVIRRFLFPSKNLEQRIYLVLIWFEFRQIGERKKTHVDHLSCLSQIPESFPLSTSIPSRHSPSCDLIFSLRAAMSKSIVLVSPATLAQVQHIAYSDSKD